MRKVKYILSGIIAFVLSLFVALPQACGFAEAKRELSFGAAQIEAYTKNFVDAGEDSSEIHGRVAGSEGEKLAALKIKSMLGGLGLEAENNLSTTDGVQVFDIQTVDGLMQSQNIIFKKSSGVENAKKVVIATHYDNYGYFKTGDYEHIYYSEGVHASGAGVGLLLAIADECSRMTFDFDIEFVFFGAHYAGLEGAEYYTSFISDEEAANILLMVNLDKVVSGGSVYLYTGEYAGDSDEFVYATIENTIQDVKKAHEYRFIADMETESVTGLDYTTAALESESAHFLRRGIKILNMLSIDDSNVGDLGIIQYTSPVTAANDTWSELQEKYGDKLIAGLESMADGVIALVSSNNFAQVMSTAKLADYSLFGNQKLAVFVTAILLIVFIFIMYLIHRNLASKAEQAKLLCNFDAVMTEVASRSYESLEELVGEVAKKIDELSEKKNDKKQGKSESGAENKDEQKQDKDDASNSDK